ncbi:hypothetical protein ERO13_A08G122500v2 [Gossypium hirsutum]|uniref:Uncharacterized protein n=1 Tax=Gossypium barbadense TaxID=3634 RepID=A0A5J5URD9_GOSBA|nr:hypothetical protein ES319_A08G133300v1 [Gossypium barbadense]KAG4187775.1 hypothetical protein ERO13_A08G122500v2 [Gossypium hirsutum]
MVRPLYTKENKGERTPHILLASILTTEKKIPATQPRGGSVTRAWPLLLFHNCRWQWQTAGSGGPRCGG